MTAIVRTWPCGRIDEPLLRQIERVARQADVTSVAVMPDVHQGRSVPNGVAVATRRIVYPDLVGSDIGCGIAAVRFEACTADLRAAELEALLERLPHAVPTLKHAPQRAEERRAAVAAIGPLSCRRLDQEASRDGAYQLGTLGRGNHFLELARDDEGALWAVVHTGSRAMGQAITSHHLAHRLAASSAGDAGPGADALPGLDTETPAGQAYFADMEWACRYAAANRAAILNAVADVLEALHGIAVAADGFVDSPHNTATRETPGGAAAIVHRKSTNHAAAGRRGVVAGSMAVGSRLVVGLGNAAALDSSAHGAGRLLSRTEARERIGGRDLEARMRAIVYHRTWANRLRDEAPQAYRDLREVMQAQHDLVRTERVLVPILNDKRP